MKNSWSGPRKQNLILRETWKFTGKGVSSTVSKKLYYHTYELFPYFTIINSFMTEVPII